MCTNNGINKVGEGYSGLIKSAVRSPLTRLSGFFCGASNSLLPICLINKFFAKQEGKKTSMQVMYPMQTKLESSLPKGKVEFKFVSSPDVSL